MTQADRVLDYIKANGSITAREAYNELGVQQLPRRIYDLKKRGIPVTRTDVVARNRYGDRVWHGVYRVEANR